MTFRTLNIFDDFISEAPGIEVDFSFPSSKASKLMTKRAKITSATTLVYPVILKKEIR